MWVARDRLEDRLASVAEVNVLLGEFLTVDGSLGEFCGGASGNGRASVESVERVDGRERDDNRAELNTPRGFLSPWTPS